MLKKSETCLMHLKFRLKVMNLDKIRNRLCGFNEKFGFQGI